MPAPKGGVDLPRRFAEEMGALLGPDFPKEIGLAVSGGGDSMAMLYLAAPWARVMGITLRVATVDHGLRAESADEAALVARACADLNVSHQVLRWDGWDGQGNLQAAARAARHDLLNQWRGGLQHILFAHTQDDQAETVLMRLARGSGVDGLAGMRSDQGIGVNGPVEEVRAQDQWTLLRPLLSTTRAELRHYLKVLYIPFADDPSNDDDRFDRVKARHALAALEPLGLTAATLAETAMRMRRARCALDAQAVRAAQDCVRASRYDVQFDRDAFSEQNREMQVRLLARALQMVASNPYRPRATALDALLDRALAGGDGVLHGGQVLVRRDRIWVIREYRSVAAQSARIGSGGLWDSRVLCDGAAVRGSEVRALGTKVSRNCRPSPTRFRAPR